MIIAQEQSILKTHKLVDQMTEMVRSASQACRAISEVEKSLWEMVLRLGQQLLEAYVAGFSPGDMGATIEYEGRTLHRLTDLHSRRYVSVFGELEIQRWVYGTYERQKQEMAPLDAMLGLPESDFSYLLQDWSQAFCVQGSFVSGLESVQRILGIGQSVRSLEHMNVSMAAAVDSFRKSKPKPPAKEEGPILVITADGKGVPMRRDPAPDGSAPRSRRMTGEKANKKREACVGAVYTIEPFVRTPEDIINEVLREQRRADRPVPQHKEVRAELTRQTDGVEITGKERIFGWFATQVKVRNPRGRKWVVCLMDGDRALWKKLLAFITVPVVCVLDLYHLLQYLWKAAHCFFAENSDEARAFVTVRLRRILEGDVGRVIGGLKQMTQKQHLGGARKKTMQEVIGYLHNNRKYMRYHEYIQAGYPIGSGVAEGACRHLVKDRMEQTGMHWRVTGAQAMLSLRAMYLNDDWEDFQAYRSDEEQRELYAYSTFVKRNWRKVA